ncbi:MAG: MerR family transcriptional regulator [Lactobacillales bacterium]|nr:MerR family transcriptional regulator [Lactobacillales bacterium]
MIDLKLHKIESLLITLIEVINNQTQRKQSSLLTQKELLQLLNISPNTLKSWENKGLKRLEPPIEGTRTVFYQLEDVIKFLSPK